MRTGYRMCEVSRSLYRQTHGTTLMRRLPVTGNATVLNAPCSFVSIRVKRGPSHTGQVRRSHAIRETDDCASGIDMMEVSDENRQRGGSDT
jgi:hypothetical protein